MNFSTQVLSFLSHLHLDEMPQNVEVMNPYKDPIALALCNQFYNKYYSDNLPRTLILGINPGRFGGGVTGIPFTDPLKLEQVCGIPNNLKKKAELSADFIYQMIRAYGGAEKFYERFYISAVSPLGFTSLGKNLNYYDHPGLREMLRPFMANCLHTQLNFGVQKEFCFCLGEDKNFKFLSRLNEQLQLFKKIIPLAHPRFIMQYRRKQIDSYISEYLSKFESTQNPPTHR